jgi:AbrB family looped-hinge helix DNA binding protein
MASIVEPDSSGRVVIPKKVRDAMNITHETQLLLTSNEKGQIILQKLDLDEITRQLKEELSETQVLTLAQEIRDEINEKARQALPATA